MLHSATRIGAKCSNFAPDLRNASPAALVFYKSTITNNDKKLFIEVIKKLKEKYRFYSCSMQLSVIAHQPT
jgi:hypothetical protein